MSRWEIAAIIMSADYDGFIGMFDSGLGGISVLREACRLLPHESFVYFGDSAYCPYGEKTPDEVFERSRLITERMISLGVKAVVVACNTATSVAAERLRAEHLDLPIIGVEPAVKPAAIEEPDGTVLVMATPITLRLEKFQKLARTWGGRCRIVSAPCPGLAERIEQGNLEADDLADLLETLIGRYRGRTRSVVLGCTHYSFIRPQIRSVLGDVQLFDSAFGTAQQLQRRLNEGNLLADDAAEGKVVLRTSCHDEDELRRYRWFLDRPSNL